MPVHPLLGKLLATRNYALMHPYADNEGPKLTAGVLMATEDCVGQPTVLMSTDDHLAATGTCEYYALFHLGTRTTGHGGIVHGGLLATLLDESLCRCGFAVLPHRVGVTASLNLGYKAPTPENSLVLIYAKTKSVEGRKVWVSGWTYVLDPEFDGDLSQLSPTMEAELLAIEPKWYKKLLGSASVKADQLRRAGGEPLEPTQP